MSDEEVKGEALSVEAVVYWMEIAKPLRLLLLELRRARAAELEWKARAEAAEAELAEIKELYM